MILSSSAVDRVLEDTDWQPRRDSSPLDSWSPTVARPGRPARIYPNKDCLAPTVPLYGGAMWDTTVGLPPQAWLGIANWGANTQNSATGGPGTAYNYDD